jgi:transcriptional regulator with XRE-family HTH domain
VDSKFLGAAFRALRREADLSQEAVAHAAGVSTRHYQDVESGRKAVSVDVAARIAKAIHSSLQLVLDRAEKISKD